MKALLSGLILAATVAGAHADALGDAAKALETGNYPQAVALFTRLADAGNAQAQFQLGELYWYGEGVPLDRAKGDALFAKSAAAGYKDAIAATTLTAQRAKHLDDIAYWTVKYDGADLVSGKYACRAPTIPAVSKTNAEIKAVGAEYDAYTACYNGFIDNLADAQPAGKRIPADVAIVMSEPELTQAKQHLASVYAGTANKAKQQADRLVASREAWNTATLAYVAEENRVLAQRAAQNKVELDTNARLRENAGSPTMVREVLSTKR